MQAPSHIQRPASRWIPAQWDDLAGLDADALHEAWNAWLRSCQRPAPAFVPLCPQVRQLSIASGPEQVRWMRENLRPWRVMAADGSDTPGLLTGYYEPLLDASRAATAQHTVALYRLPAGMGRRPWYSRQEMDTLPQARQALQGQEIAWLADPLDALVLQIQGSGLLRVTEPDGQVRVVRVAYAGTNEHPYRSVGRWLLDQGELRDASWPAIKAWARSNPGRLNEMLWSNPRVVFFREEAAPGAAGTPVPGRSEGLSGEGPRGAQGVPLTAGRSIAVDPRSVPYGTPVWLASSGPVIELRRLVLAQDTGSAIVGAARADYFVGTGDDAAEIAGRLKQPLSMWVLWPIQAHP